MRKGRICRKGTMRRKKMKGEGGERLKGKGRKEQREEGRQGSWKRLKEEAQQDEGKEG